MGTLFCFLFFVFFSRSYFARRDFRTIIPSSSSAPPIIASVAGSGEAMSAGAFSVKPPFTVALPVVLPSYSRPEIAEPVRICVVLFTAIEPVKLKPDAVVIPAAVTTLNRTWSEVAPPVTVNALATLNVEAPL